MIKKRAKSGLKSSFCLIILLFTTQYCSEPFDFDIQSEDQILVVDGFITDQFKPHIVRLSYTSSIIDNNSGINPARGANVVLSDDLGNVVTLTGDRFGNYQTPPMQAEEERSYQLTVRLNNRTYQSTIQSLPKADFTPRLQAVFDTRNYRDIIQGSLVINRQGLSISALIDKSISQDEQSVHYQWFVSDCRVFIDPEPGIRSCQIFGDILRPSRLHLHKDNYISGMENADYFSEIFWVPKPNSANVSGFYVVEVDQLIISPEAYEYWSEINDQVTNTGTFFDPAPARVHGNIEEESGEEVTLGFFGVYRESGNWERVVANGF